MTTRIVSVELEAPHTGRLDRAVHATGMRDANEWVLWAVLDALHRHEVRQLDAQVKHNATMSVALPSDLKRSVRAAAAASGLTPADFHRRALEAAVATTPARIVK